MDSSVQIPTEADPQEMAIKLIKAMETNADSKEALKKAYQVLSKDENASLPANVLPQVLPSLGMNLTDVEVNVIIHQVKPDINNDEQINCEEFLEIMKNIWTKKANELIKAMEKDADSNEALRKSYQVLSKDPNTTVSTAVLRQVMSNLEVKLTDGEVDEIINQVKANVKNDGLINCEEFVNIMKNVWTKLASKLINAMEEDADSHEALKKAYLVLTRDDNAYLSAAVLRQVVPNLSMNLTDVEVDAIIHQVKPSIDNDGQINCEEFFKIMKNIWTKKAKELMKAMEENADSNEALKNSYQVLSKDPNASLSAAVLRQVMANLGVNLTDVEINEIITHIKPNIKNDGQINCEEFANIMKNIWTKKANELIKAMEKYADSNEALRKSYQVLSKDPNTTVSTAVLCHVMSNLGVKLTDGEVDEIIKQVKANVKDDGLINCEEFVNIMKNTWTKIANKLIKAMEEDAVSHEALKKAYLVLSRDENVSLSVAVLRQVMPNLGVKRTDVEVDVIINLVKPNISSDGRINCEEFVNIMKKTQLANKLVNTMEEDADSHKVLQNAYLVLSGDENASLSVDVLHQVMPVLGMNLTHMEIDAVIQQVKPNIKNDGGINRVEFVEIMKNIWMNIANKLIQAMEEEDADLNKALKKAYLVLSRDENASFSAAVLCWVMPNLGMKLTDVEVNEIINGVNSNIKNDRHINCEEFVNIMKNIWTMMAHQLIKAMEEDADSNKALEKSYQVLRKDPNASLSAAVLRQVMANLGVKLTDQEVNETINRVKPNIKNDRQINREEFVNIMKNIWMKIANKLIEEMERSYADSYNALQKAYLVLSRDKNTSFSAAVLCQVMPNLGLNLTDKDVYEIINQVKTNTKNDRQIYWEEFVNIMNNIWAMIANQLIKAMEEDADSNKALEKSYQVLRKDPNASLSIAVLRQVMENLGVKLTNQEVNEIINRVKPTINNDRQINREEFVNIMKNIWTKIANKMIQEMEKSYVDSHMALQKAYLFLSRDENTSFSAAVLCQVMPNLGLKLTDKDVHEIINQVKTNIENDRQINCEEFVNIMKKIWTKKANELIKAMDGDGDSDTVLKQAYSVLTGDENDSLSAAVLRQVMPNLGVKLTDVEVDEIIRQVKPTNLIKFDKFIEIIEKIWTKACNKLTKADDPDAYVPAVLLRKVMPNLGVKLAVEEVEEIIEQVKPKKENGRINHAEIIKIIKFIKEPTVENQFNKIYGILNQTKKIVLYGKPGVGKSWMARKIANHLERNKPFDIAIWIYLHSGLDLYDSIASQLSPQSDSDKVEAKQDNKETSEKQADKRKLLETILKKKGVKRLLLILYGERSIVNEDVINVDDQMSKVGQKYELEYKLLFIIPKIDCKPSSEAVGIMMMPLTQADSTSLLTKMVKKDIFSKIREFAEFFIDKSQRHYAEVLIISKIVNYFGQTDSGLKMLQSVKDELLKEDGTTHNDSDYSNVIRLLTRQYELLPISVLIDCYSRETPEKHFLLEREMVHFSELISYWILEGHLGHFDRIEDAYKKGHDVLMELLDYGILKHVENGYVISKRTKFNVDIHDFCNFFQNIRLGLATVFDNKLGSVVPADGMIKTSSSDEKSKGISTLLLDGNRIGESQANLFKAMIKALGNNAVPDETVQSTSAQKRMQTSTLTSDQSRIGEVPRQLIKSLEELEILAIFNPTRKPFPLPLYKMPKLRLLVLRGCKFLESFDENLNFTHLENLDKSRKADPHLKKSLSVPAKLDKQVLPTGRQQLTGSDIFHSAKQEKQVLPTALQRLTVLEISGPSSLKKIPDDLFKMTSNLKSLNLSFLQIVKLPESFYSLSTIEFLILRGCSCLEKLESLKNFGDLQVLDLSGATSFKTFQDKNFSRNKKLQILNLSQTKVTKLPLISHLQELKFLSLSACTDLSRLRKIGKLERLQILDISGAERVDKFLDPSLEGLKSLVVLNVSGTAIKRLPSIISSPVYLYLRDCSQLEQLPRIKTLANVQELDLSGSVHLEDIKEEFIKDLTFLRKLNLSKTKVVSIPSLSSLGKLRHLLLSQCLSLKSLEGLSSLKELEFLDLSGCKALLGLEDKSFDEMKRLCYLNLSEIQLKKLPSLSNLKNLKELHLRNCPELTHILDLRPLEVLEVLDYSRTPLKPSFAEHAHPRVVIGPSPSSSENFDPQNCLKELGCTTEELPSDISKLIPFQQHEQENEETQVGGDEKEKPPPKEMNQCYWSISRLLRAHVNQKTIGVPVRGHHFLQLLTMYPFLLKENIRQFHFFVYPEEAHTQFADEAFYVSELELRDIYFQQVSQDMLEAQKRCLEIRGFPDFPQDLGQLLKHAEFVVLIENSFIRLLSDLGADNIKQMKVCWIERCNNMDHVIFAEEAKESKKPAESVKGKSEQEEKFVDVLTPNLEILWVSDVPKLSSISNHNSQGISFKTLKSLYLEYCPELSVICTSPQQLSSLEILYVRYCQKLETLFGDEPAELPKLHSLHLWGLPELKKISCTVRSLRILRVEGCHLLENIFDASTYPGHLESLQVKFCDQLNTIIKGGTPELVLGSLKSLNLLNLPRLNSIGAEFSLLEKDCKILGCPKLPKPDFKKAQKETLN